MKVRNRRMISLCMAFALCITLALPASANSCVSINDEYGKLQGKCYQNAQNPYILNISTSVTKNNNGAYLKMHVDIWEVGGSSALHTFTSEPGDLLLAHDIPLYVTMDFEPERVFVDHQIVDPNTGGLLYEVSTSEVFSFAN